MSIYRHIYLRPAEPGFDLNAGAPKGHVFANVHYLVGYNQGRIKDYRAMARKVKKAFPHIVIDECECNHVTHSTYCKGFTLLRWDGFIKAPKMKSEWEAANYPGWRVFANGRCDYSFI